ncbi:hypothetical protein ONZ51_g1303 [Trametes cubensis]|uniref:Uncharacterized protein n=1 Tax=Trametes cubensis TaxID=1111947 RepID=A0AAD7U483_9APHY|nr:hypothetical protein ONZ51_g1303 [Trametes cubensis]
MRAADNAYPLSFIANDWWAECADQERAGDMKPKIFKLRSTDGKSREPGEARSGQEQPGAVKSSRTTQTRKRVAVARENAQATRQDAGWAMKRRHLRRSQDNGERAKREERTAGRASLVFADRFDRAGPLHGDRSRVRLCQLPSRAQLASRFQPPSMGPQQTPSSHQPILAIDSSAPLSASLSIFCSLAHATVNYHTSLASRCLVTPATRRI